ncbi:MAG: helicase-exonuclease AddAB subunit AddA [Lachnospiraceae bacterium]|nr:helicase-exonuclease AddAB subunit AddA [Lachnospiraceae bacterium]
MAGISFTEQQKQVIRHPTCDLLVSAAAGSGKTAVLVQRIMELVLDGPKRKDIDRILVVTFTRNAAAQMKERIMDTLSERLAEQPDDAHLLRQMNLVHYANIMTIDSFCQSVVKSYFQKADVDPTFRAGDDAELRLLWEQALSEVLEEAHEAGEERFLTLVSSYGGRRSDEPLAEAITRLNSFAESDPWPELWLKNSVRLLREDGDFGAGSTAREACAQAKLRLSGALELIRQALAVCREPDGPSAYADALLEDESFLTLALRQESYAELAELFAEHRFPALSRKRQPEASEEKKSAVQERRKAAKAVVESVKNAYFFQAISELAADTALCAEPMETLAELTIACRKRYWQALLKNNVLGFSDIEHLALSILVERGEDGALVPSEAAGSYAEQFDEIMIDEYQDSNLVQDLILTSVSGEAIGRPNLFVVGDVKQSIYKFRMARPELFLEKYRRYRENGERECRIDLSRNFRSRETVLASVNRVFEKLMTPALGGIAYDEKAALRPGADYPAVWEREQALSELVLLDPQPEQGEADDGISDTELYVQAVAERIQEIVRPGSGYLLKDGDGARPAGCGDIVVLVRSLRGIAKPLVQGLLQRGIEAYVTTMEGYFTAVEVQTVLNLLRILDNPLQDIPMAAVLHSPIGEFGEEELARLRILGDRLGEKGRQAYLYDTMRELAACAVPELERPLREKTERFLELYDALLPRKQSLRVSELLEEIYRMTGYLLYCQAMPGGDTRKNHLEALVRKAREFQSFAYTELCDFIAYIDRMISYQVKVEDGSPADSGRAVRIMTIHASKGLEFPIVILPDLQRKFNLTDTTGPLLLHEELGLGPVAVDLRNRTKVDTLAKKVIACRIRQDSLGEELRILYTAMTRAKEKLILFGEKPGLSEAWDGCLAAGGSAGANEPFSFGQLYSAGSYLDWLLPAVVSSQGFSRAELLAAEEGTPCLGEEFLLRVRTRKELRLSLMRQNAEDFVAEEGGGAVRTEEAERVPELLADWERYEYPHLAAASLPVKLSVSELKMSAMEAEETPSLPSVRLEHPVEEEPVPKFLKTEEKEELLRGSDRGTLYHRLLELHDFRAEPSRETLSAELRSAVSERRIPEAAETAVSTEKLYAFCASEIGRRMRAAALAGRLHKEQNFVLSYPARELSEAYDSEEPVLVQGIIDVFFEEEDGVVLLDYKTDRVDAANGEEILRRRYRAQLAYYADAIARGTGKPVKERLIYSFALQKCFAV